MHVLVAKPKKEKDNYTMVRKQLNIKQQKNLLFEACMHITKTKLLLRVL